MLQAAAADDANGANAAALVPVDVVHTDDSNNQYVAPAVPWPPSSRVRGKRNITMFQFTVETVGSSDVQKFMTCFQQHKIIDLDSC